jgi:hypothetical protein
MMMIVIMIVVAIVGPTEPRVDAGALEIQAPAHLVLVARQRIVADGLLRFDVPAAIEIARDVDTARAAVDGALRIGTERTGAAGLRGCRTAAREQRLRRHIVLDPVHQRAERIDRHRTRAVEAAMADTGRAEQAVEVLQVGEVRPVMAAVA